MLPQTCVMESILVDNVSRYQKILKEMFSTLTPFFLNRYMVEKLECLC